MPVLDAFHTTSVNSLHERHDLAIIVSSLLKASRIRDVDCRLTKPPATYHSHICQTTLVYIDISEPPEQQNFSDRSCFRSWVEVFREVQTLC